MCVEAHFEQAAVTSVAGAVDAGGQVATAGVGLAAGTPGVALRRGQQPVPAVPISTPALLSELQTRVVEPSNTGY